MRTKRLHFENEQGITLKADLDLPDGRAEPEHFALFAHCFTCNRNYKAVRHIGDALTETGFGVLRFDFTGLGESAGEFSETTFSSNTGDLRAAARFLKRSYRAPSVLIGHSLGGAAALMAARDIPSTRAVVTIAAPSEPSHVNKLLGLSSAGMAEEGARPITIAGRSFTIKKQFVEDLEKTKMADTIHALGKALLVMHSPKDRVVGIDNAAAIFQAALHPKSFLSLDPADHLITDPADSRYAGAVIGVWASRYLTEPD